MSVVARQIKLSFDEVVRALSEQNRWETARALNKPDNQLTTLELLEHYVEENYVPKGTSLMFHTEHDEDNHLFV